MNSEAIHNTPHYDSRPWYKQFWPWFLIALPTTVIIACFFTIYLAIVNPLNMVKDNYYKEGLEINKDFSQQQLALDLGIRSELSVTHSNLELTLHGNPEFTPPTQVMASFTHPLNTALDFSTTLKTEGNGIYSIPLPEAQLSALSENPRWYVNLEPVASQSPWLVKLSFEPHFL